MAGRQSEFRARHALSNARGWRYPPGDSASGRLAGGRMRVMPEPGAHRWPRMVRGSVVTHRRRCGKPNCRCATGEELHESTVLSYSEAGRTRFVMLPAGEVAAVRAAVERYRAAQAKLAADGDAGRAALIARLAARGGAPTVRLAAAAAVGHHRPAHHPRPALRTWFGHHPHPPTC